MIEPVPTDADPVWVVVIHRNKPDLFEASMAAWRAQTVPVRMILVDSGSTEEAHARAVAALPDGSVALRMGGNGGFGPSANVGWRHFLDDLDGDWVGLAPHDALPAADAVERILGEVRRRPRAGFACGDYGDGASPIVDPYFGSILAPAIVAEGWDPVGYPHGTLLFSRRAALEDVGLFDERYFAYCEEADLGLRARAAGWDIGLVRGARVDNPNMSNPLPVVDYLMVRNTLQLVRRHQGRYKAFIRFCIAVAQLWTERETSPYHDVRARLYALRDVVAGRSGPPPPAMIGRRGQPAGLG